MRDSSQSPVLDNSKKDSQINQEEVKTQLMFKSPLIPSEILTEL